MSDRILNTLYGFPAPIPANKKIALEVLQEYAGVYAMGSGLLLRAYVDDGYLVIQPARQPSSILYPESDHRFYVEEIDGYVEFLRGAENRDTLQLFMRGEKHSAPRIQEHWGIIGSATKNGWDGPDQMMMAGAEKGIWLIKNLALKNGEIKFRMNKSWDSMRMAKIFT